MEVFTKTTSINHLEQLEEFSYDDVQTIDPVAEAKLIRKLDLRLMPIVTLIYLFAFIDRSNAGNARVLGKQ